jgi:hypothetical protein
VAKVQQTLCRVLSIIDVSGESNIGNKLYVTMVGFGLSYRFLTTIGPPGLTVGEEIPYEEVANKSHSDFWPFVTAAMDLAEYGTINFAPPNPEYAVDEGVDPLRGIYLRDIFLRMLALGEFSDFSKQWGARAYFFTLQFDANRHKAEQLFELGWLLSEYRWKFETESDALHGRFMKHQLDAGREKGAKETRHMGRTSRKSVLAAAQRVLKEQPHLFFNQSALSKAIISLKEPPLRSGRDSAPLKVSAVRTHIAHLIDSGELSKPA